MAEEDLVVPFADVDHDEGMTPDELFDEEERNFKAPDDGFSGSDIISGTNIGVDEVVGAPVDAATAVLNVGIKGLGKLAGKEIPPIQKPFLGSEYLKAIDRQRGGIRDPNDESSRMVQSIFKQVGAGAASLPLAGVGALKSGAYTPKSITPISSAVEKTAIGKALPKTSKAIARVPEKAVESVINMPGAVGQSVKESFAKSPAKFATGEMLAATGAGVVGEMARDVDPDLEMAGQIAGSVVTPLTLMNGIIPSLTKAGRSGLKEAIKMRQDAKSSKIAGKVLQDIMTRSVGASNVDEAIAILKANTEEGMRTSDLLKDNVIFQKFEEAIGQIDNEVYNDIVTYYSGKNVLRQQELVDIFNAGIEVAARDSLDNFSKAGAQNASVDFFGKVTGLKRGAARAVDSILDEVDPKTKIKINSQVLIKDIEKVLESSRFKNPNAIPTGVIDLIKKGLGTSTKSIDESLRVGAGPKAYTFSDHKELRKRILNYQRELPTDRPVPTEYGKNLDTIVDILDDHVAKANSEISDVYKNYREAYTAYSEVFRRGPIAGLLEKKSFGKGLKTPESESLPSFLEQGKPTRDSYDRLTKVFDEYDINTLSKDDVTDLVGPEDLDINIRQYFANDMIQKVSKPVSDDVTLLDADGIKSYVKDNSDNLVKFLGKDATKDILKVADEIDFVNKKIGTRPGLSLTGTDLASEFGVSAFNLPSTASLVSRMYAYQLGKVGKTFIVTDLTSRSVTGMINSLTRNQINTLVKDSLTDPELAASLLQSAKGINANPEPVFRLLRGHLISVFGDDIEIPTEDELEDYEGLFDLDNDLEGSSGEDQLQYEQLNLSTIDKSFSGKDVDLPSIDKGSIITEEGPVKATDRALEAYGYNEKPKKSSEVADVILATGGDKGRYLLKTAEAESSLGKDTINKTKGATAKGVFQFTDSTWKSYAKKTGVKNSNPNNATLEDQVKVMKAFTEDNEKSLKKFLKRDPNNTELYIAHFLGAGGARTLLSNLKNNPNKKAKDVLPKAYKYNKEVFGNRSVKELYSYIKRNKVS